MASSHFIVEAVASAHQQADTASKRLSLDVEVEGSAPIKSQAELLRAAREIARDEIERAVGTQTLGEFKVAETKPFDKTGEPLTSPNWPGTLVWRVSASEAANG